MYWAIVTLTTVGYGDLAPQSGLGRFLASIVMLLGYSILAVPTGIFTSELLAARRGKVSTRPARSAVSTATTPTPGTASSAARDSESRPGRRRRG